MYKGETETKSESVAPNSIFVPEEKEQRPGDRWALFQVLAHDWLPG